MNFVQAEIGTEMGTEDGHGLTAFSVAFQMHKVSPDGRDDSVMNFVQAGMGTEMGTA